MTEKCYLSMAGGAGVVAVGRYGGGTYMRRVVYLIVNNVSSIVQKRKKIKEKIQGLKPRCCRGG